MIRFHFGHSLVGVGAVLAALGGFPKGAFAHVTLATSEARSNASYKGVLQIPHGCAGEATQAVSIRIPDGIVDVEPVSKPGWAVKTTRNDVAMNDQSISRPGKGNVVEIEWSEGSLPSNSYDEFVFTGFVSADLKSGQTVYFPTVQRCAKGEAKWTDVPGGSQHAHDLKAPAPQLKIVAETAVVAQAKTNRDEDHGAMVMPRSGGDTYKAGDMLVVSPWTRATPGGAKIGGGYLKITNNGSSADRLVGISAAFAGHVELHEMSMTDGVMKMRPLANGLEIKPGETIELKPGGFHMMFMDLKQPLKQGDALRATLTFEKAGTLDVNFNVGSIGAAGAPSHQH